MTSGFDCFVGFLPFVFAIVENDLLRNCHDDGHSYIQRLCDLNDPLDSAVISRNKTRTIEILREAVPNVRKMIPYLKTKPHCDMFNNIANECDKLCRKNAGLNEFIRFGIT